MAKKNPYVMTIGFNKEDSDHVYVADILNTMGRRKAQYIVKAVITYQSRVQAESGQVLIQSVDYETIKAFVLSVLKEEECVKKSERMGEKKVPRSVNVSEKEPEKMRISELDEETMNNIMMSLSMFQ